MAHLVKNLPDMQGTQSQSLGHEDLLEKAMATHSRILGQRSLVGYSPWGKKHLLTPHHNDVAWLWQIQFLQLLPLDTDFKWWKDISYVSSALKCNALGLLWKNTKEQDYFDVGIATALSVNANTATSYISKGKTIYQVPKCKIYSKIDRNIKAI